MENKAISYESPFEYVGAHSTPQHRHKIRQKRENYRIKCANCGKYFNANRSTARYCCNACKAMYARKMLEGLKGDPIIDSATGAVLLQTPTPAYRSKKYKQMIARKQQEIERKQQDERERRREEQMVKAGGMIGSMLASKLLG